MRTKNRIKTLCYTAIYALLFTCAGHPADAFVTETEAPGTPQQVENDLIAAATTQFNIKVVTNPFFPNTYQLTLFGYNPNYNPAPTTLSLINNLVTVDSYTYVYGWADGMSYQQAQDMQTAIDFTAWCSSAPYFGLVTIDSTTCVAVAAGLSATIQQLQLSTPTVVPGNWQ